MTTALTSEPTERQAEVLAAIRRLKAQNGGTSPSLRELAQVLGISHSEGVRTHLRLLRQKGYIAESTGRTARNIRLTPLGESYEAA